MRRVDPIGAARLAVLAAFLLASLAGGAAARAPAAVDPALAAFLAIGGTAADICGEHADEHAGAVHCDGCRPIGAAPVPPAVDGERLRRFGRAPARVRRAAVAPPRPGTVRPAMPRAPPRAL